MVRDIIVSLLLTAIGTISGWLAARNKNKAEAKHVELQNVESAISIWRNTAEALHNEVVHLRNECNALRTEVENLRKENRQFRMQIQKIEKTS